MADADRLPRTSNIGRAAGLDPRPSLSKPTTAVCRVYLAHFLGTDVVRTVGYPTSRRTYHGHGAGQRAVEGRRSLGRNDRRAADPRLQGGDGPPSRGGAGGKTAASPAARCPAGLSFECHGSDVSVDTDTPVLGAGNETSWTCPRRRIEYGGNQIFVKISSRFCLLWWVIPPVRGNGVQRRRLASAHHGETVTPPHSSGGTSRTV
jgi:hypothetical protein